MSPILLCVTNIVLRHLYCHVSPILSCVTNIATCHSKCYYYLQLAPAIEFLQLSYPEFTSVDDLPIEDITGKVSAGSTVFISCSFNNSTSNYSCKITEFYGLYKLLIYWLEFMFAITIPSGCSFNCFTISLIDTFTYLPG